MKPLKYIFAGATIAVAAIGGASLSSCNNLDESPYTFMDPTSYYNSESDIETALNATYNRFRRIYSGNNALYLAEIELLTEQGWPTYNKDNMENISTWTYANDANTGGVMKIWGYAYETINRANIVLGHLDGVTMSSDAHNRIEGQAKFLRGYTFFHLLRLHGGVPLPLTYTAGTDGLDIARASLDETYAQIISDLQDAINDLPVHGTDGYDTWRLSKGAAQAALAEVYLYRGTMNNNNQADLQKSMELSEAVINSNVYELTPNFTDNFYWFNTNSKNNKESLFELQYSAESGQSNCMHIRFGVGRTNKAYMGCYQYARFGVSGYLYREMLANGDKRANACLTYFEGLCGPDAKKPVTQPTTYNPTTLRWEPQVWNDRPAEMRAVFNCKYFDQHTDADLQLPCANFPIIRYSEVLLNYAEAANLLNGGSGLAQLNEVRIRAGLSNYTYTSQQAMDNEILNQRRYEFVGEGKIFYDELRKDKLADYATEKCKQATADGITYFSSDILFKPQKTYLFKIPQGDLDSNTALVQNDDNVSR